MALILCEKILIDQSRAKPLFKGQPWDDCPYQEVITDIQWNGNHQFGTQVWSP
jgi:hypothetical protein